MSLLEGPCHVDDFEFGVTLGTGSFGRVRLATHKETSQCYAIKMLKKSEVIQDVQAKHMLTSEKEILFEVSKDPHPFIVNVAATFQDPKYLYIALEYVNGGEFFSHLTIAGRFDSKAAQFYAAHIVLAFEHLHAMDILYRDLKPENLLLGEDGYLKITDFGSAKKMTKSKKTYTLCGTPEYVAPEMALNQGHGKGVDWWALGILTYEILAGEPPFVADSPNQIYKRILSGKINFHKKCFEESSEIFIRQLLMVDVSKRLGCKEEIGASSVKSCDWFLDFEWDALHAKELDAPIKPEVSSSKDTSNFDFYPDSTSETEIPLFDDDDDPFQDF